MAGTPATPQRMTVMKFIGSMPGEWRASTAAASGPCNASSARSGRGSSAAIPCSVSAIYSKSPSLVPALTTR